MNKANVLRSNISSLTFRAFSTAVESSPEANNDLRPIVSNRNPRNLERMRIARKPVGYYYDKKNVEFWHRVHLEQSNKYVTATLVHNSDKTVVVASTREWAIRQFLYSATDRAAHLNLARIFAERCLETGITHCCCDIEVVEGSKTEVFLKTLEEEGITLKEPEVYDPKKIWHRQPEKKPWLVHEE